MRVWKLLCRRLTCDWETGDKSLNAPVGLGTSFHTLTLYGQVSCPELMVVERCLKGLFVVKLFLCGIISSETVIISESCGMVKFLTCFFLELPVPNPPGDCVLSLPKSSSQRLETSESIDR